MNTISLPKNIFPQDVIRSCQLLRNCGKQAFVVGGSIRDIILGFNKPLDWDIATDATPKEIIDFFKGTAKVIPTGLKHGTITLIFPEFNIEVTTFRTEDFYKDGRRPLNVNFVNDITEDLSRRDLTINAIGYDPIDDKLVDPFNGIKDITDKVIRMVGDPNNRLQEDGLRLIRIFRFVSKLGFRIESKTYSAIPNHFETFKKVSKERIISEFEKLLLGYNWKEAIILMRSCGLLCHIISQFHHEKLKEIIPEIKESRLALTLKILNNLEENSSLELKYAVLFHQISSIKLETKAIFPPLKYNFVQRSLWSLKFSNKQIEKILHLLAIHLIPLPYFSTEKEELKDYNMRKFQYKVKPNFIYDYLMFIKAKEQSLQIKPKLTEDLISDILSRSKIQLPIYIRNLNINGDDIIRFFTLNKSSPSQREFIGLTLRLIRERVEVDPRINNKRNLFSILKNLNEIFSKCKIAITRSVYIISTDHIRKLYRNGKPDYSSWENKHVYILAQWLMTCLLRKKSDIIVIFDGTNFNLPNHPTHRESLAEHFKRYNPIFINVTATTEEVINNYALRKQESDSIKKSDANLSIYERYGSILQSFSKALATPEGYEAIEISTYNDNFMSLINTLCDKILHQQHRFIVLSGNVLTGKTYTANMLKKHLEKILSTDY